MAQATLKGVVKWFKYLDEPKDNKFKPLKNGKDFVLDGAGNMVFMKDWATMLAVDSSIKQFLRQNKIKKQVKFDDDIGDYINLTLDYMDKKTKQLVPRPQVVDENDLPWDASKWIGHGTLVEVTCELKKYDFKSVDGTQVSGASLIPKKFKILEHVPYTKPGTQADTPKRVDNTDWSNDE